MPERVIPSDAPPLTAKVLDRIFRELDDLRAQIRPAADTAGVEVQDESLPKGGRITTLNFTGAGVTVTVAGTTATIDIP